jgi:hypothetical protein
MAMSELTHLKKPEIEEVPRFFDFKKRDFTKPFPPMANLNYDPFPNAKDDDTVRTEIIARDLVLRAKLKGPADALNMGMALEYDGNKYALTEIGEQYPGNGECIFDVTGVAKIAGEEPLDVLTRLRSVLAASNKN